MMVGLLESFYENALRMPPFRVEICGTVVFRARRHLNAPCHPLQRVAK